MPNERQKRPDFFFLLVQGTRAVSCFGHLTGVNFVLIDCQKTTAFLAVVTQPFNIEKNLLSRSASVAASLKMPSVMTCQLGHTLE